MQKIQCNRKDIELFVISAGHYFADAGAAMGVLPYKLWSDNIVLDQYRRVKLDLNCLLIKIQCAPESSSKKNDFSDKINILVDCGIGNCNSEKLNKIYQPSNSTLINELASVGMSPDQINMVVLTHLHFDHAGGILEKNIHDIPTVDFNNKRDVVNPNSSNKLLFKNAKYLIQKDEWETALNPDSLNMAAYTIIEQYNLLNKSDQIRLIEGEIELYKEIFVEKVDGHSPGMQVLKINDLGEFIYFGSDAFPLQFHLTPSVTSAYDISRKELHKNKEKILKELKSHGGKLIFSHEIEKKWIEFNG